MIQDFKKKRQETRDKNRIATFVSFCILVSCLVIPAISLAQSPASSNPNSAGFRLVICDGPAELNMINPETGKIEQNRWNDPNYIACNFRGLMRQVQHLITAMLVLGVFVAIIGFSYAGFLYIRGTPATITRAHNIFPKVGLGFIIMLSAWFIVYQILAWLTGNPGLKTLLGTP